MTTTVQMERNPNGGGPGAMESAGEAPPTVAAGGEKNASIVGVAGQQKGGLGLGELRVIALMALNCDRYMDRKSFDSIMNFR